MASKTKSAERFKQEIAAQRARAEALQHLTETGSGPSQRELAQQEKERSKYLNMTSETIRMRLAAQSGNISNNSGGAPTKDNTLQEIRANRARQMIHQLGTANQQYNYDSPGGVSAQFANLYPCSTSAPTNSSDLPDGWREAIDPSSGSKYYWNQVTKETSWTRPNLPTHDPTDLNRSEGVGELADGWEVAVDEASGSTYYYNLETGVSSWERPSSHTVTLEQARAAKSKLDDILKKCGPSSTIDSKKRALDLTDTNSNKQAKIT